MPGSRGASVAGERGGRLLEAGVRLAGDRFLVQVVRVRRPRVTRLSVEVLRPAGRPRAGDLAVLHHRQDVPGEGEAESGVAGPQQEEGDDVVVQSDLAAALVARASGEAFEQFGVAHERAFRARETMMLKLRGVSQPLSLF